MKGLGVLRSLNTAQWKHFLVHGSILYLKCVPEITRNVDGDLFSPPLANVARQRAETRMIQIDGFIRKEERAGGARFRFRLSRRRAEILAAQSGECGNREDLLVFSEQRSNLQINSCFTAYTHQPTSSTLYFIAAVFHIGLYDIKVSHESAVRLSRRSLDHVTRVLWPPQGQSLPGKREECRYLDNK